MPSLGSGIPRTILPIPLPCPVVFLVWATRKIPEGPTLRLRLVTDDGRRADLCWGPEWARDHWGVPGRAVGLWPFREALEWAVGRLGETVEPSTLDLVCSQLSDPMSFWDALWVMGS